MLRKSGDKLGDSPEFRRNAPLQGENLDESESSSPRRMLFRRLSFCYYKVVRDASLITGG